MLRNARGNLSCYSSSPPVTKANVGDGLWIWYDKALCTSLWFCMRFDLSMPCTQLLAQLQGDAYCIPRRTPFFLNPSQRNQDIVYHLTGFTGSSAHVLITSGPWFLYVDPRYTLQAQEQCPGCTVITCGHPLQALPDQCPTGTRLILSPWTHSAGDISRYTEAGRDHGWTLIFDDHQALEALMPLQPTPSVHPIYSIPDTRSFQEKCRSVFTQSNTHSNPNHWLMCSSADIAWLTHMRGSDHDYSPFFDGYLFITQCKDHFSGLLYTAPRPILGLDPDVQVCDFKAADLLCKGQTNPAPLEDMWDQALLYDPQKTPHALVRPHWVAGSFHDLEAKKSIKNSWEMDHMIQAHGDDGVALTQFLYWLSWIDDETTETEWSAAEYLHQCRARNPQYKSPSFATISAMGSNSAMMHYTPSPTHSSLLKSGLYLVDSGGQYGFGTTDVTRTVWLGPKDPPIEWKHKYTQVLQGHIHLSSLFFPKETLGVQLDAIARSFLWQKGWDYAHSTGHGVGCFGSVHEFPPSISSSSFHHPIKEHMVFSVEPGYYESGSGGIRLENVVRVKGQKPSPQNRGSDLLHLDPLTLAPFDGRLIDVPALSSHHKEWLNQYHKRVYDTLSPQLPDPIRHWLEEVTQPV